VISRAQDDSGRNFLHPSHHLISQRVGATLRRSRAVGRGIRCSSHHLISQRVGATLRRSRAVGRGIRCSSHHLISQRVGPAQPSAACGRSAAASGSPHQVISRARDDRGGNVLHPSHHLTW
jgi:hypothetical protein